MSSSIGGGGSSAPGASDPSFERWIRKKELLERGLELFSRLDAERGESEDKWKGVAKALQAIKWYYLLTVPRDDASGPSDDQMAEPKDQAEGYRPTYKGVKTVGPGSLFEAFRRWTMEHYTFFFVKLSPQDLTGFSSGAKEFFMKDEEGDGTVSIMPSLKYAFPKKPEKKDEKVRPLTKDQKLGNAIFLRLLKESWTDARKELEVEVDATVSGKALPVAVVKKKGGGEGEEGNEGKKQDDGDAAGDKGEGGGGGDKRGPEAGGKDGGDENVRSNDQQRVADGAGALDGTLGATTTGGGRKKRMVEIYRRGLPAFNAWLEEDEDAKVEKKRESDKDKEKEARKLYEGFVRRKDETRIRLPTTADAKVAGGGGGGGGGGGASRSSRFDFSRGKGVIRPKTDKPYSTTVDMMMGSGLKYVHALKRGTGAIQGDLEKCRQQLLDAGFVAKENFDREDMDKYEEEKRSNAAMQKRKEAEERRREETERAFQEWVQAKALSDQAAKFLLAVDPPNPEEQDGIRKAEEHWLEVGRALKAVDANLLKNWLDWSKDFKAATPSACQSLWDAFSPLACDIHCKISTSVKDIFLKLLRPGINYRRAFEMHCDRVWKRMLAEDPNLESEIRYDSNPREAEDRKKKELMGTLSLDKKEMKRLIASLGIVMQDDQLRKLIDAFDKNGDGVVSMQEFLDFVGEERSVKGGDKQSTLQHKCIWSTTCDKCGMPAAYTISIVSSRSGKNAEEKKDDEDHDNNEEEEKKGGEMVVKLSTGEQKRRIQMSEHLRRVDLLRKFGFNHDAEDEEGKEREYEDDFDQDHHNEDEQGSRAGHDSKGNSSKANNKKCEACTWTPQSRMEALEVLSRLSQDNREAQALQKVLSNGSPPPPPKLFAAKLGHRDVGDSPTALTTELLLLWKPPADALVAFVVLEQQTVVVTPPPAVLIGIGPEDPTKKKPVSRLAVQHQELARDPPDAEQEAKYSIWVRDLKPNTSYTFRLRAFNGFGAGSWTHGVFTTRPVPPPAPLAGKCTPTSVTLRWKDDAGYEKRLAQLKKLFDKADADGNRQVSREELLTAIRSKEPQLMAFLKKVQIGEGVSVFDAIELDDNETLSWEEFRKFFDDNEGLADDDGGSVASASKSGDPQRTVTLTGKTRYVVQRCESHADDEQESQYKDVYRCTSTQATIRDLKPGITYRFRVCAVNCDMMASDFSPPVVVTTTLETPTAPRLAPPTRSLAPPTCLKIVWDKSTRAGGGILHKDKVKGQLDKTLADWTKSGIPTSAGFNLRSIFSRYDANGDGTIDVDELDKLLQDLGVPPTEEKKREALDALDVDDDDKISFDEFRAWWESDDIAYVLKRTDGIPGHSYVPGQSTLGAELKTVCFKGPETSTEVAGLVPNTFYVFRLRTTNSRCASILSSPLYTMTPPNAPEGPLLARVEAKEAILRWYPPAHGAHKYILQQRFIECLDNVDRLRTAAMATPATTMVKDQQAGLAAATSGGDEDWTVAYEGQRTMAHVTGLALNSVYRFRVIAVNAEDIRSNPSPITQVTTVLKSNRVPMKPLTASECFPIDCTGDVVEGDTILFTERLYRSEGGELIDNSRTRGGITGALASPGGAMTPRLHMTAFSVGSLASGRSRALGEFAGERTVAAYVWNINDFTSRKSSSSGNNTLAMSASAFLRSVDNNNKTGGIMLPSPVLGRKGGSKRMIRMEVVWNTVSRDADDLVLSKGTIIERLEDKVFQYETFRMPWEMEKGRKSSEQEQALAAVPAITAAVAGSGSN